MKKINIFINNKKFEAELNETKISQEIYKKLPLEAKGNFWGNEIYFNIPIKMENEVPTQEVELGDLGYWPEGPAFCIFYGRTPVSFNDKPRPLSPITIIGRIKADWEELKKLSQTEIRIEKS